MEIGGYNEIIPLEDRIIVKPSEKEEMTSKGIIIPDSQTEGPTRGEVVAVGPGKMTEAGVMTPMNINIGDEILYATKYYGTEVNLNGELVVIIPQTNVLAILKKAE